MKKIAIILVLFAGLSACTKDLTSLNVDVKNPQTVPSYSLFTQAERTMASTASSSNVNLNIFRLIEQQWEETTYTDESNYDIVTRQIPDGLWNSLYRDVLFNMQQTKRLIPKDVSDPGTQKNEIAIADIMQVYAYYYLVTTFGNIPYSQALDISKPFPVFDDAKTVYYDLLTRLDADIAALDPASGSYGAADIIYAGDPGMWKKFAATFKLKMGITIADFDNAKAQATIESAVATGVFTSNSDNAVFKFVAAPPNTNPIWVDLVQSGRQDFVADSTVIAYLQPAGNNPDPRLPYYFTLNHAPSPLPPQADTTHAIYAGANSGASATFSNFSKPSGPLLVAGSVGQITNPDFPGLLLDYAETEFNLAEATVRGYNVGGGTVISHYNNGITASILYWDAAGTAPAAATAYLAQSNVAYATAAGLLASPLKKIGIQKYLAFYNRGWDAWIDTRRLGFPALVAPPTAKSAFPLRFVYPVNEQNVNIKNYNAASTAIGGDLVTTKLFFIK